MPGRKSGKPDWPQESARRAEGFTAPCFLRLLRLFAAILRANSLHRVDPAGLLGEFHELHRDVEFQVLEFFEGDAAAASLHLAELCGVALGEVAFVAAGANMEAVMAFPHRESDQEPLAFAAAGGAVAVLAVADDGRAHAGGHIGRELR